MFVKLPGVLESLQDARDVAFSAWVDADDPERIAQAARVADAITAAVSVYLTLDTAPRELADLAARL